MLKILLSLYFISCSNNQNNKKQEIKKDKKDFENISYKIKEVADIISSENIDIIKQTFNSQNVNVKEKDSWSNIPLYIAISNSNREIVKFLLSIKGIGVNARVYNNKITLLSTAIKYFKNDNTEDRLEIIKLLVKNGAIIYYPKEKNEIMQPLYYALDSKINENGTYESNFDLLEILLNEPINFIRK